MSLISMVAYGSQDMYLMGKANILFPKLKSGKNIKLDSVLYSKYKYKQAECAFCLEKFKSNSQVHITKCFSYISS
jgi:hypothetical protein